MSPYTKSQSASPRRRRDKESPGAKAYGSGRRCSYSNSRSITPPARRPPSPPPLPSSGHGRSSSSSRSSTPQRGRYRHGPQHMRHRRIVESRCIGVFGLNISTTQATIREIFSKFGPIDRIQVVIDAQTKRSRGFCFIYYQHLEDAKRAKQECCGIEIDGRLIRVDYSITQRPHSPTPGVYMGRYTNRYNRQRDREREYSERYRDSAYFSRSRQPRTPPSPQPARSYSHRSSRRSRSHSGAYERSHRRHRDENRSRSRSRSYTPRKRPRY